MIRQPCTDFLTRPSACLPACLPACLSVCLSVCLLVSLSVCQCLPVYICNFAEGLAQLIVLIRIVLYGRSLAVHSTVVVWGASLGGLDSIRRWADIEALVQFNGSID